MNLRNVDEVKKIQSKHHGETALYQVVFTPERDKSLMTLFIMTVKPGGTNKLHTHESQEQIYMILEGGGTVQVGEEKRKVRKGDAVYLPPKVNHGFFNDTDKKCVILCAGSPAT
jgi:quercetin dioxygenase-like cupin family protein